MIAVGPDRDWNTWDARYPGAFVHRPTGLTVRLSAYAGGGGRGSWTDFPYGADVRLGPHLADGSFVELELPHAGARLRLRFAKPSPGTVVGEVGVLELPGWGLRFWLLLEVGFPDGGGTVRLDVPEGPRRYVQPPVATIEAGPVHGAFSTGAMPVGAHLYADRLDARMELEAGGYYARPPAREEGRWAQFRFAATEPRFLFALRLGDGPDGEDTAAGLADELARADASLEAAASAAAAAEPTPGRAAIRDVVAWNTVWDPFHGRPYTVATRAWAPEKFGGWFVWLSDAFYAAILAASAGDAGTARANIDAALSNAGPEGTLAGLTSGRTAWIDRSQLPIGAHATWLVHRLTGDGDVVARAYPILRRAFWRWFETRDGDGNGLLEPGSSPVGDGHFVHTKQAALDEAAMDNSAIYDEATFDPATHTLDCEDVALNSQLVLEGETLARIAGLLDRPAAEADALRERSAALAALVRDRLWDPARRIFANRLWDGRFVRSLGPSSFYPMLAGIATPDQADALVRDHLTNPEEFWGEHPVAGTPFDDPAAADDVYWRGRVWPTMNYLVWLGLVRSGHAAEAAELASRSRRMFERSWAERRCFENLSQRTGDGGGSPDSDPFYTWGALLALIGDERVAAAFLDGVGDRTRAQVGVPEAEGPGDGVSEADSGT